MILIVDGMNLFIRGFVANPSMSENGFHVGGVVGFLNGLRNCIEKFKPTDLFVIWEGGGSARRRAIYSDYKKKSRPQKLNRFYGEDLPDTAENRNQQISMIVNLLRDTPACQLYIPDCEADDVIGYLSKYKFAEQKKLILSSDKDFYQLLDDKTILYSPTLKDFVTKKDVLSKFGISAHNFCLAKSLCGDPSDNIKGIKGAGFKTIAKRFPEMGSENTVLIEDILKTSQEKSLQKRTPKIYKEICDNIDDVKINWKLIYLDTTCLSSSQIDQIHHNINTFSPRRHKIDMLRKLIQQGIQNIDVDRLFLSFSCVKEQ
jgi:DNA polymerase-1